jgi:NADH-quinone oxidoreductase subunit N
VLNALVALPEILLMGLACLVLLVDVFRTKSNVALTHILSQATLVITISALVYGLQNVPAEAFNGLFIIDRMSVVLKLALLLIGLFVFEYARVYLLAHQVMRGEFYVLGLFAILGMMVLISANNLLSLYLGLELSSLSMYAMVALQRDSKTASEAAMKYFVLGALSSGLLLYGISIIYGLTGSLDLSTVAIALQQSSADPRLLVFAVSFVVVGIAFKLGAVPVHMWVPDVYQGAPTAVTLFVGSIPKIAAFAMAIRLLVNAVPSLAPEWHQMLIILAFLSLALGNVVAIAQNNIKRMLAYSTIGHIGFLLLGLLSINEAGYAAAMFYVLIYALMSAGAFGVIIFLSGGGTDCELLSDFQGLAKRAPWHAFLMLILMFSMAGIPPFAGFWAKWFVLVELVAAGQVWLAAFAVIFSVIGAYYYLRVVKLMYFDEPVISVALSADPTMAYMLSLNGLAVLGLGIMPGALMGVCISALSL